MRFFCVVILFFSIGCRESPKPLTAPDKKLNHHRRAWPVMGTVFSVDIWSERENENETLEQIWNVVARVDERMSTYKESSEISVVNLRAGKGVPTVVSDDFLTVLEAALDMGKETSGAFNVAVGPLISLWNFYESLHGEHRPIPNGLKISEAVRASNQQKISIHRETKAVSLLQREMRLDFGSIAKGFALDQAAKTAKERDVVSARFDLGGQLIFFGKPYPGKFWNVDIRNPSSPAKVFAEIQVKEGSVATSGDYDRFFEHNGKRYTHILNPRTGWPVQGVHSVTVWAPSAIMADAWSTALFVSERDERLNWMKTHPEIKWIWMGDSGVEISERFEGYVRRDIN